MIEKILGASFASLVMTCIAVAPVWADCAEDIEKVDENKRINLIQAQQRNIGAANKVDEKLDEARQALAEGKKKRCANLVKAAQGMVDRGTK